jgi:Ca2+-binding RTX toxin-like protein
LEVLNVPNIILNATEAGFFALDEDGNPEAIDVFGTLTYSIGYWFWLTGSGWIWRENAEGDITNYTITATVTETMPVGDDLLITIGGLDYTRQENGLAVSIGSLITPDLFSTGGTSQRIGAVILDTINDPDNTFVFNGSDTTDYFDPNTALIGWQTNSRIDLRGGDDYVDLPNDSQGNATILGGAGNDTLRGGEGNDVLDGGDGDDFFEGRGGDDLVRGGNGNDGRDVYGRDNFLGDGNDTFEGGAGSDVATGGDGNDTLWGMSEAGNGNTLAETNDGSDTLYGRNGDDLLYGNQGNDSLLGQDGNDTVIGGQQSDYVNGGDGNDFLYGDGLTALSLEAGNDTLDGEFGNDFISGGQGQDHLIGRWGNDTLEGGSGDDTLDGGSEDDTINGGEGDDDILGGRGNDEIIATSGADLVRAGSGADTIVLSGDAYHSSGLVAFNVSSDTQVGTQARMNLEGLVRIEAVIDGGDESDIAQLSEEGDAFFLHDAYSGFHNSVSLREDYIGNESVTRFSSIEEIRGMSGNDIIDLTSPDYSLAGVSMTIDGGEGNDVIWGSDANENIFGGNGNDTIFGGIGADILTGDLGSDVFEFTRTSTDTSVTDFDVGEGDALRFYNTGDAEFDASSVALTENGITISYTDMTTGAVHDISIALAPSAGEFTATLSEVLNNLEIT